MIRGEWANVVSVDDDHPEQLVRLEHRYGEHRPNGVHLRHAIRVLRIDQHILDMYRTALQRGTARGTRSREGHAGSAR